MEPKNYRVRGSMPEGLKFFVHFAVAVALFGSIAKADEPKELKTVRGKAAVLGEFLNTPSDCSSNPIASPLPTLREKPSHGIVLMQIGVANVPATGACPARKIPVIALVYSPATDFVGTDSVQIEFKPGAPPLWVRITVQEPEQK
jgi:hypothetical protein